MTSSPVPGTSTQRPNLFSPPGVSRERSTSPEILPLYCLYPNIPSRLLWFEPFVVWRSEWRSWIGDPEFKKNADFIFHQFMTEIHRKKEERSKSLAQKMNRIFSNYSLSLTERTEKISTMLDTTELEELSKTETSIPEKSSVPGTSTLTQPRINPWSSQRPRTSSDMLPLGVTRKRPAENGINSLEKKKKKEQRPSSKL